MKSSMLEATSVIKSTLPDLQLNHAKGLGNIFTSPSDEHWRLVRKGIMPAFNSVNIR